MKVDKTWLHTSCLNKVHVVDTIVKSGYKSAQVPRQSSVDISLCLIMRKFLNFSVVIFKVIHIIMIVFKSREVFLGLLGLMANCVSYFRTFDDV